jgi:S1-C subfamily serine protease
MTTDVLKNISADLETLVGSVTPLLVHIGGEGITFRTGLVWDDHHVVTTAIFARDGEPVEALAADGKTITSVVQAFDAKAGIALLKTEAILPAHVWEGERPRLGALAISVAFPSPAGPEARLDMVRCVGEGYFQTDGAAYPGFGGAAVLGPSGQVWGMVTVNASGNRGSVLPFAALRKIVEELERSGSRRRLVLGVRTQTTEDGLLVTGVEPESAAREAGLVIGDILTSIGDRKLATPYDLLAALENGETKLDLSILRGGKAMTLAVTPRESEPGGAESWTGSPCCGR